VLLVKNLGKGRELGHDTRVSFGTTLVVQV
jgi:hypothetical protein